MSDTVEMISNPASDAIKVNRLDAKSRAERDHERFSGKSRAAQLRREKNAFYVSMATLLVALLALAVAIAAAVSTTVSNPVPPNGDKWERDYAALRDKLPLHFNQLVDIPTIGARDSEWFSVEGQLYIAFSSAEDDSGTKDINSQIWRFNRENRSFVLHQNINVYSAHDADVMIIGGETYLTFASKGPKDVQKSGTKLFKYNKATTKFDFYQDLDVTGKYIRDIDHFQNEGADWIVLCISERKATDGTHTLNDAKSEVWKWDTSTKKFKFHQSLDSLGARDAEFFVVEGVACIAIANTKGLDPAGGAGQKYPRIIDSYVYKWDTNTAKFVPSDNIPDTEGNYDFNYFELQTRCLDNSTGAIKVENASFLAAAFSTNGVIREVESPIYKWHGWETGPTGQKGWIVHQKIPGLGARDVEFFQMPSHNIVAAASGDKTAEGYVATGKGCPRASENPHNTKEYRSCVNSFLAIANHEYNNKKDNDVHSAIYAWSMWQNKFIAIQSVPTFGMRDFAYWYDAPTDSHLLSTASSKEKKGTLNTESFVLDTLGLRVPELEDEELNKHYTSEIPSCG